MARNFNIGASVVYTNDLLLNKGIFYHIAIAILLIVTQDMASCGTCCSTWIHATVPCILGRFFPLGLSDSWPAQTMHVWHALLSFIMSSLLKHNCFFYFKQSVFSDSISHQRYAPCAHYNGCIVGVLCSPIQKGGCASTTMRPHQWYVLLSLALTQPKGMLWLVSNMAAICRGIVWFLVFSLWPFGGLELQFGRGSQLRLQFYRDSQIVLERTRRLYRVYNYVANFPVVRRMFIKGPHFRTRIREAPVSAKG